jgi:ketosteroid isomerase-like protein
LLELCDPELRLDNIAEFPDTGPYHGHEGLRRWWQDVAEAFDEIRFEIDELIDVDAERVLSVQRVVGRFRNTGIPVDTPWASLFWVRGGKIAPCRRLRVEAPGPQGRRAAGVGDVAGDRRGVQAHD